METRNAFELEEESRENLRAAVRPRRRHWRDGMMARAGRVVLAVCPSAHKSEPCTNVRCVLRPLCACAQAEIAAGHKVEARVWLALALCAAILLIIAFIRILIY